MKRRNLALNLTRVTERAAVAAGRHMGFGDRDTPDCEATHALRPELDALPINGRLALGAQNCHVYGKVGRGLSRG